MNIEYEALKSLELKNVVISIPLPALRDAPVVNQVDGDWRLVDTFNLHILIIFLEICLKFALLSMLE